MNAVKAAGAQPARASLALDAGFLELIERDHAVLPCSNPDNEDIRSGVGAFCMHVDA
jgi:hypothetical protein